MESEVLFYLGNNGTLKFTFYDEDRAPINLTGGVLTFSVKARENDTTAIISKVTSESAQGNIPVGTDGIVNFLLIPADTEDLRPKKYVYDVQFVDSNGKTFTMVKDVFELVLPIT